MKKIALVFSLILVVLTVTACSGGNSAMKDAAGTYKGQYTKLVGDDVTTEEEFSLELKSNGKGTHNRDELSIDVTWKLDGENFSMTETFLGATIEYTGTLKDGKLDIFNGDPEDIWTYEYVYEKQ